MKNKMKLLITTRADEGIKDMTDITHPIMKNYAERVGADFLVLSHKPPSDSGDNRPHYRILKHFELHEQYDRILHLDSDMIVLPDCPNLFEVVPYEKIGTVLEDKGSRRAARRQVIQQIQQKFGPLGWREEYINTGLLLTSKCHRDIFQAINGEYWTGFGSDDAQLGYLIKKMKYEIMDLPFQYNHMTMFSESWNNSPNRFSSHIIHYGGRGIFDSNVNSKMEQIRKDYNKIYAEQIKILFVGVFDTTRKSTNTSQLLAFKKLGFDVTGYNYRAKATSIGAKARDEHLSSVINDNDFSLVVFSKCNLVSPDVFKKATEKTKTCLWFMDPLQTYDDEMKRKSALVTYVCCDKENVVREALKYNSNTFRVCEGFDQDVDKPRQCDKLYDVSFIGNIYGHRAELLRKLTHDVKVIGDAYGPTHSEEVSRTNINLNFCTDHGASDRVYKVMAAGGFLLSDDWYGREEHFKNGRDCVIFEDLDDLETKIKFYLNNPTLRKQIAQAGQEAVSKFDRLSWAKKIIELYHENK
jgi:lipopolysaccharide biosynthesis glycosyltransferase